MCHLKCVVRSCGGEKFLGKSGEEHCGWLKLVEVRQKGYERSSFGKKFNKKLLLNLNFDHSKQFLNLSVKFKFFLNLFSLVKYYSWLWLP